VLFIPALAAWLKPLVEVPVCDNTGQAYECDFQSESGGHKSVTAGRVTIMCRLTP
jgi:hypothetical protein